MSLSETPRGGQDITAFGHEDVTVANTAGGVGFTTATIAPSGQRPAHRAVCTAETAQMRYTYDGTAPTTGVGHLLEIGDTLVIEGISNVAAFRAIRTGGTSGHIMATYERYL